MQQLILKKLHLQNFKGVKDLEIDFTDITTIQGANATGKSTIFDAYSWLLWDKNSVNKKDFNIKPLDEHNEVIHGVEPTVTGQFEFEDKKFELKKVYKEIWTKKRGQTEATFTGNTTEYYINSVPISKGEYDKRIESIVSEKEFNLLSNPAYFSSILDKKERREVLLSLIKNISKDDVLKANSDLKELDLENYTIEELKAMAKSSCKKTNEEIQSLPIRIDELIKSKKDFNFVELEDEKDKYEKAIGDIDSTIAKTVDSTEVVSRKNIEIQNIHDQMAKIKAEADKKNESIQRVALNEFKAKKDEFETNKRELKTALMRKESKKDDLEDDLKLLDKKIKDNDIELSMLRDLWVSTNDKVFDGSLNCPTCQREFDEDKKEEILSNFNLEKSKRLTQIQEQANEVKELIEKQRENYTNSKNELEKLTKEIAELEQSIENYGEFKEEMPIFPTEDYPAEYYQLELKIDTLKEELRNMASNDNSSLLSQKKELQRLLDEVKEKLSWKRNNAEIDKKAKEYKKQEKELAKIFEEQQKIIFLCEEYTRIYTSLVQDEVNGLFTEVNFRLFKTLVNGSIEETCDVTVKGVPYVDVNNAGKINAGLDVIKTLSKHYEKQVPIFVDNAESVNELTKVGSQIVKLYVSKDKKITVKGE